MTASMTLRSAPKSLLYHKRRCCHTVGLVILPFVIQPLHVLVVVVIRCPRWRHRRCYGRLLSRYWVCCLMKEDDLNAIAPSSINLTLYGCHWRIRNANKNGAQRLYYSSDHPKMKLKRNKIQFPVFFISTKYDWMLRTLVKGALKMPNWEKFNILATPLF